MRKPTINWTPEKLAKLKLLYAECEDGGVFQFEGHDILKSYAKYLIEYLDGVFGTTVS